MAEIQTLDDDDDIINDIEFLTQLEFAESQASLSLSTKRRRITLPSSPPPEGAYTAALRGSKSLTWQAHATSSPSRAGTGSGTGGGGTGGGGTGGGGSGGACFKCRKEGHWARDCEVSGYGMGVGGGEKSCPCGMGSCLVFTANTERNRGRKFFRCPLRQENGGCGFFEWCDDSSGLNASIEDKGWKNGVQEPFHKRSANQGTCGMTKPWNEYDKGSNPLNSSYGNSLQKSDMAENKSYNMRSGSSCFKCGEEGHWARDCLATSSNATTAGTRPNTSSSSSSSFSSFSSDACYKCGGSGHWARDCSQGQGQGQSTKIGSW